MVPLLGGGKPLRRQWVPGAGWAATVRHLQKYDSLTGTCGENTNMRRATIPHQVGIVKIVCYFARTISLSSLN